MNTTTQPPTKRLGPGDDLEMINSPALWPWRHYLPVKNPEEVDPVMGTKPNVGVIVSGQLTVVHIGCLFTKEFSRGEKRTYPSVEALIADGWIVD